MIHQKNASTALSTVVNVINFLYVASWALLVRAVCRKSWGTLESITWVSETCDKKETQIDSCRTPGENSENDKPGIVEAPSAFLPVASVYNKEVEYDVVKGPCSIHDHSEEYVQL